MIIRFFFPRQAGAIVYLEEKHGELERLAEKDREKQTKKNSGGGGLDSEKSFPKLSVEPEYEVLDEFADWVKVEAEKVAEKKSWADRVKET